MKEYKYDGYASCDNEYRCTNYSSSFHTPNDFIPLVGPGGEMGGPWGAGGNDVIGDGFYEVPKDLRMHYYSETEDKFYEGTFDLPSEEIEKMLQEETTHPDYQGKTFDDTQSGRTLKYMKYNKIIASVSLGGEVTLWMAGMDGQKIIATYFAKEALNVDWSNVTEYSTRKEYIQYGLDKIFSERIKQEIKTKTLPYKLWQTFKEKHKWRYKIEGNHGEKLTEVYIKMINAEEEKLYSNNPVVNKDPYTPRAIPYNFELVWQDASGKKYSSWMILREDIKYYLEEYKSLLIEEKNPQDFLEEEIFKVFSSLDKDKPIDIIFRVNGSNKELKVIVKQENKEISLTKITVRVFKID